MSDLSNQCVEGRSSDQTSGPQGRWYGQSHLHVRHVPDVLQRGSNSKLACYDCRLDKKANTCGRPSCSRPASAKIVAPPPPCPRALPDPGRPALGRAQHFSDYATDHLVCPSLQVLSVIAQQMLAVTTAIAAKATSLFFEGRDISLNHDFGVFITMNPGYAGRQELPDNLKALFRPVCLMVPDYGLIAEVCAQSCEELLRPARALSPNSTDRKSKGRHPDMFPPLPAHPTVTYRNLP